MKNIQLWKWSAKKTEKMTTGNVACSIIKPWYFMTSNICFERKNRYVSLYLQCNDNHRELPPSISSNWLRWLKLGMKYDYIDGDFHQMILSNALLTIVLLFYTIVNNNVCWMWNSAHGSWYIFKRKLKWITFRTPTTSTVHSCLNDLLTFLRAFIHFYDFNRSGRNFEQIHRNKEDFRHALIFSTV